MKKGIIVLSILIVFILGYVCLIFCSSSKEELKEEKIFMNEYIETYETSDNWIEEETLQNKVSIKNTENFTLAIRISFEDKMIDQDGNEISFDKNLIESKIYDERWIKDDIDNYYYYKYALSEGEEINLSQYLVLNNSIKDKRYKDMKYVIATNIETVQYDKYIDGWNIEREKVNVKEAISHDEIKKLEMNMKEKEDELLLNDKIERTLNNLTLEEKIGQMMIISLHKNDDRLEKEKNDYNIDNLLDTIKPGGVIVESVDFKKRNMNDVISLTKKIRNSSLIPMIISVDQEGGRVQRLRSLKDKESNGITYVPPMSLVGEQNDKDLAYDVGRLLGMELNVFGFNLDFAPNIDTLYVDSNVIGDRSFGNDAKLVAEMGISVANGLKNRGIIPVYKHFPNHGSTSTDSHKGLPSVNKTKEELMENDLHPFSEAIKNNASIIMVGHLYYPEISDVPASLSKEIINDLLKEEMGFNGLVVTDSLRMDAIVKNYSEKEVYEMAINAGVDLLLMPYNSENTIKFIKQSISEEKISEEQINNSVRKILKLKYTSLGTESEGSSLLDTLEYKELSAKVKEIAK